MQSSKNNKLQLCGVRALNVWICFPCRSSTPALCVEQLQASACLGLNKVTEGGRCWHFWGAESQTQGLENARPACCPWAPLPAHWQCISPYMYQGNVGMELMLRWLIWTNHSHFPFAPRQMTSQSLAAPWPLTMFCARAEILLLLCIVSDEFKLDQTRGEKKYYLT